MLIIKEEICHFLKRLSEKMGLDIIYLIKNGNWVSIRFVVLSLSGFFLSLFFAKFGSKELLGQYQLVLSIMSIVSICSLLGLNASALEAVAQGRVAGVLKVVKLNFLFGLIGIPFMIGIGLFYYFSRNEQLLGETLIFVSFLFPFFYALGGWNVYYEGMLLFKKSSLRIIFLNIIQTIALILGIIFHFNVLWLVILFVIVNISLQALFFLEIYREIPDLNNDKVDVKFGVYLSFQKFVSGLASSLPPLIISFFFGIELLAIYYIAFYVISALASFMSSLISLYTPILFKKIKLDHINIVWNNLLAGIIIWIVFIIFLKIFFLQIYGKGYGDSLKLAYIISFLLLFIPMHTYLVSFFSVRRKNSFLITVFCVANVVGLLAIYMTKSFGFFWGVPAYLYALEITTTIPLAIYYIFGAAKIRL